MLLYTIRFFHEDLGVSLLSRVFPHPMIRSSFQLISMQVTFHDFVYVHADYNRNEQFRQASISFSFQFASLLHSLIRLLPRYYELTQVPIFLFDNEPK